MSVSEPLKIMFFTSPGCKYCKPVKLFLNMFRKKYPNMIYVEEIDITQNPAAVEKYNISALPTLIFGKHRLVGKPDFHELISLIENELGRSKTSEFIKEKKTLKAIIQQIKSISGVNGCIVFGESGFLIASNLQDYDATVLAAMMFTSFSSAKGAFNTFDDNPSYILYKGIKKSFALWNIDKRILMVIYESDIAGASVAKINNIINEFYRSRIVS